MSAVANSRHHRLEAPHRSSHRHPEPSPPIRSAAPIDRIRRRAFEIFMARQGRPGDPIADWLQAERELAREAGTTQHVETRGEILMHDVE